MGIRNTDMQWRFIVSLLCALTCGRAAAQATQEHVVLTSQLDAIDGRVGKVSAVTFAVEDAEFRADALAGSAATLMFTYLGPSSAVAHLSSGEVRRQAGLKLHAENECNLIYVMWHFDAPQRIEVSVKENPGSTTHAQCGDSGYTFIQPSWESKRVPVIARGETHKLRATLDGRGVRVYVDGNVVWEGRLPASALQLVGPVGLRSDNVQLRAQLNVGELLEATAQ
jgi:hypothetical protein